MGLIKKNLSIILDLVRKERIDKEDAIDLIEGLYNKPTTYYTYPWTTSIYDTSNKNTITTSYKCDTSDDTSKNTITTNYSSDINSK